MARFMILSCLLMALATLLKVAAAHDLNLSESPTSMAHDVEEGGYTPDGTWNCGRPVGIQIEDCTAVREELTRLGDKDNGWWKYNGGACKTWTNGECQANLCPFDTPDGGIDVYMPDLAWGNFYFLNFLCGVYGQRGQVIPNNETYTFYVSEPGWDITAGLEGEID